MKAKAVTGSAGVHFVAYRLSAMGYIVALTREGAPAIDLMVYSPKSGKAVSIQVKTASNASQLKDKKDRKAKWSEKWELITDILGQAHEVIDDSEGDLRTADLKPQKS